MIKKPLVLTDGEIEQLQSGDSLSPAPNSLSLTNGESVIIPRCAPVFILSADTLGLGDSASLPDIIGLTADDILVGGSGVVQTDGVLSAASEEWDVATGQTGGLTPGATYYLNSPHGLTAVPVATGFLVRVGIAVNSTGLDIKISRPIRL